MSDLVVTALRDGTRHLVDGQQRLTTLTLLLIHLRHLLEPEHAEEASEINPMVYSTSYGVKSFNLDVEERTKCVSAIFDGHDFDLDDAGA